MSETVYEKSYRKIEAAGRASNLSETEIEQAKNNAKRRIDSLSDAELENADYVDFQGVLNNKPRVIRTRVKLA